MALYLVKKLPELNVDSFRIDSLPRDVSIGNYREREHRDAFLETFECFLSANSDVLKNVVLVEIESEEPLDWKFTNTGDWKESLKDLAEKAYDSWNDEIRMTFDSKIGILVVMDPVYYARI